MSGSPGVLRPEGACLEVLLSGSHFSFVIEIISGCFFQNVRITRFMNRLFIFHLCKSRIFSIQQNDEVMPLSY